MASDPWKKGGQGQVGQGQAKRGQNVKIVNFVFFTCFGSFLTKIYKKSFFTADQGFTAELA